MLSFIKNLLADFSLPVSSAGRTDIGMVRENNEDSFGTPENRKIFFVADGMGGHLGGEVASRTTVELLRDYFSRNVLKKIRGKSQEIRYSLISSFELANDKIMAMSANDEKLKGMGCTLVVALVDGNTLHTCHVGDARCYVARGEEFHQITTDHTTLTEMQKEFDASEKIFTNVQTRHVVTRVIGYPFPEPPEYNSFTLVKGDRVLLCSDGLWSMITDEMIHKILTIAPSPDEAADQLIDLANTAGGEDNITAVTVFC